MASETKEILELLSPLLGMTGLGGVLLGLLGHMRSRRQARNPAATIDGPTIGYGGLQAIGAGLYGQDVGNRAIAVLERLLEQNEKSIVLRREEMGEQRAIADRQHVDALTMKDQLDELAERLRHLSRHSSA